MLILRLDGMESMELRSVGGSGVEISRVGLGAYELGPEPRETPGLSDDGQDGCTADENACD